MTANPIQAATARLTDDVAVLRANAGRLSHFGTPLSKRPDRWNEQVARDLEQVLAALAEACRQIAERDEALKKLADEIEHEGLRIGIRSLSQTGPHDDEGLGYSDGLKACAKMIRRLLSTEPAGGGETFSPEQKRQAWSLVEGAVEALAHPSTNGGEA